MADRQQIEQAFEATADRFGGLDVLVNAAGISAVVPAELEEEDTIREIIDVNHRARRHGLPATGRVLRLQGWGRQPDRELAAQRAPRGIRVNAIAPGTFRTEMSGHALADPEVRRWVEERTPMRRLGEVSELAGPCVFLASDASSFVTGQMLAVNGGWTCV